MIVNTATGEILDLSPLRRKPIGPTTKRLSKNQNEASFWIGLVALLIASISLAF